MWWSVERVLKVGGRLAHADITMEEKHPIILPKSKFTMMMIQAKHQEFLHPTVDWLHFHLRQNYLIVSSRQLIKRTIHACFKCQKANAVHGSQLMDNLQEARVIASQPFTHVGVDYIGEIRIKKYPKSKQTKLVYVVVFTCLAT